MYKCLTKEHKNYKKYWLSLPNKLYSKNENPQDLKTEKQILNGTHPISKDIEIFPYVILENDKAVCRALLTYYKNDNNAYVGFFESIDNQYVVNQLFTLISKKAIADNKEKIIGPIDASIYINYRFKINMFEKTYTSEPYNKDYYHNLWINNGFQVSDKYYSYQLRKVIPEDNDERFIKLLSRYEKQGYKFVNAAADNFNKVLKDIYPLLMERYSEFAAYKKLSKEQFITLFSPLKNILNFSMVKLVYKEDELFAFCVCLPNYKTLTRGNLTISKLLKINKIKKAPEEYIVLYLGASRKTLGLGAALVQMIRHELLNNQCYSIAALIHEGNTPEKYYNDLHTEKYEYYLYSKNLK